jgi:hypothetical protein
METSIRLGSTESPKGNWLRYPQVEVKFEHHSVSIWFNLNVRYKVNLQLLTNL